MMDKVLVTGGLGYIGGRIACKLAEGTFFPLVTTRRSIATRPAWLNRGDIISLDLMDEAGLVEVCRGVRHVVHLAAVNEIDSLSNPQQALIVNTLGTLNLLRAAERAGVERIIYFSTAHVYGAPLEGEITEFNLPKPVHPYAITHRAAEDFVLSFHKEKKLIGIVLRLSNGFGAPTHAGVNRWTLIVNDLCRQAVTEGKLTLHSAGTQVRDFIPLSDVGRAVVHFLCLPVSKCGDGLFNLGGEHTIRIIDLAGRIADRCEKVLGFRPLIFRPEQNTPNIASDLVYSIEKIKETGFSLVGDIDTEIDMTLKLCLKAFGGFL